MLVMPSLVGAAPAIFRVLPSSSGVEQGAQLLIEGDGFGLKEDAAPVLADYVSEAYENGILSTTYSNFDNEKIIEPAADFPGSRWAAATSDLPVRYDTTSPARHRFDGGRYHLSGENSWLGRPVAYGGVDGWDTPKNNPHLYVSWWVKVDYNSLYYWRIKPYELAGEFEKGEEVLSDNKVVGEYIGLDRDGLLNFVFPGHRNANNLVNIEIIGRNSGARTVFPNEFRGGDGYGFQTPGTKTLRIWDDPSSRGIRTSLSHTDYFLVAYSNSEYSSNRIYQLRDLKPDVWHHFEVELNVNEGTFKSWFNGELGGVAQFDPRAAYQEDYSPTIALIGNNGKQDLLQNMYISEIYMDKSVQRVIVGDTPSYEDLTHYEIQRPLKWDDNEIEVALNLGALEGSQDLYVNVFDENGVPNQQGFELCGGGNCPVPPQRIQLRID